METSGILLPQCLEGVPRKHSAGSSWQTSKDCTHPISRCRRSSLRDRLGEIWTRLVKLVISHLCGKGRNLWVFSCAKDGNIEEWHQDKYYKNSSDSCIPIGHAKFRFMKKFSGGYFFSGRFFGIQSNDKRKCKFRGNCFVVNKLSCNIIITWVGRNQIIVAKAAY